MGNSAHFRDSLCDNRGMKIIFWGNDQNFRWNVVPISLCSRTKDAITDTGMTDNYSGKPPIAETSGIGADCKCQHSSLPAAIRGIPENKCSL